MKDFNDIEKIGNNLYVNNGKNYRLTAKGTTPNRCWLIAPILKELIDIDIATGKDVYGKDEIIYDVIGSVSVGHNFIYRN